ncbi:perilipin-1-like [Cataglyphis hispanica]|uniref:perilipin-1-like n=1 Tax=Cataglyphis hispanica TaxID=1086592 RepID=UPI0021808FE0|nr:perilipin-1-like [Cataglyphis hispanica]
MTDPDETSREINLRTSSIVRIAYHQLSVMCGTHDPTLPTNVAAEANARNMTCTRRLLALPVFASVSSALRNAYVITKNSHESIAAILSSAEDGVRAGCEFTSPVTGKIADVLETPFKTIDNAVCVGLDFVEEKIPSVKLPPDQIYASMKDGVRNMFTSALEMLRFLFGGTKNQIEDLSVANKTIQEEIRKVSS